MATVNQPTPQPKLFCPKCGLQVEHLKEYVDHRIKCANNDPEVIKSLVAVGLLDSEESKV